MRMRKNWNIWNFPQGLTFRHTESISREAPPSILFNVSFEIYNQNNMTLVITIKKKLKKLYMQDSRWDNVSLETKLIGNHNIPPKLYIQKGCNFEKSPKNFLIKHILIYTHEQCKQKMLGTWPLFRHYV